MIRVMVLIVAMDMVMVAAIATTIVRHATIYVINKSLLYKTYNIFCDFSHTK